MIEKILQTEPARFISLIVAVLGLAVSYGLVTQVRADAWIAAASLALPVVMAILQGVFTRRSVFSPETTQAIADRAAATGETDIGNPPDASPPLPPGEG